jgi:hypothetical protein
MTESLSGLLHHYLGFSTVLARLSCTIESGFARPGDGDLRRPQKRQIKVNRLGFTPQENDRMQPAGEYDRR